MKTLPRVLAMLALLTLLAAPAASAQADDPDLYAPMECDAGSITVESVAALAPDAQSAVTHLQTVLVTLRAPADFLLDITDLHLTLGTDFFVVNADTYDVYFPCNLIRGETAADTTALTLVFYLPEGTTGWDYYFVYLEQIRYLAATGQTPDAFTAEPADDSMADDTVPDEAAETDEVQQAGLAGVLEALAEPIYETAYASLAQGNVIAVDDRSDDAKSLQTLLNAFGYQLTADGWAGGKTFEKLNELRAVFGIEPADSIDADGFAYLLQCLLTLDDPTLAQELLVDEERSYSEFTYLLGCCAQYQGRYYSAAEYFADSDWADGTERSAACIQPWPENGEVTHNPDYVSSRTTLSIEIEDQADGYAMFLKLYSSSGDLVSTLFAGGCTTVSTSIPSGIYKLKAGMGDTWYGPLEAFGETGYYEIMLFDDGTADVTLDSGYSYTLTINTASLDPEADKVDSDVIDWDAF